MSRYANATDKAHAQSLEPLVRFKKLLEQHCQWTAQQQQDLEQQLQQEIEQEVQAYLQLAPSHIDDMFAYLYSNLPTDLAQQREQYHVSQSG